MAPKKITAKAKPKSKAKALAKAPVKAPVTVKAKAKLAAKPKVAVKKKAAPKTKSKAVATLKAAAAPKVKAAAKVKSASKPAAKQNTPKQEPVHAGSSAIWKLLEQKNAHAVHHEEAHMRAQKEADRLRFEKHQTRFAKFAGPRRRAS